MIIYQSKPNYFPSFSPYRKSWTDSHKAYTNIANSYASLLIDNEKLSCKPYRHFITIYIRKQLPIKTANQILSRCFGFLKRRGVVAFWVKEPTRKHKLHVHLLVNSQHTRRQLEQFIEQAMPSRKEIGWHKQVKPIIGSSFYWCFYICKGKIPGIVKSTGKYSNDMFKRKRLLFAPGLRIKKVGTIGAFWHQPLGEMRKQKKMIEENIAHGLSQFGISDLAEHVYQFLEGTVSKNDIKRSFALHWNSHAIQKWIKQLKNNQDPGKE